MRDLIVFGGQSNMQGQTERLADNRIVKGAWEYRHLTGSLVPLCDPCGEDIRSAADFCTMPEYRCYMNPHVGGHYSASGLEKLGELAGEALARIAAEL